MVYSGALDISNAGQIVGTTKTESGLRAFISDADGSNRTVLGTLGGGKSTYSLLNDKGFVAGISENRNGEMHVFLWSPSTGMVDIGTPGPNPRVTGFNINNEIIGIYDDPAIDYFQGFVWRQGEGFTYPAGTEYEYCIPNDINNTGQIAGCYKKRFGSEMPCIWDSDGVVRKLGQPSDPLATLTEVVSLNIFITSMEIGFTSTAMAINDKGQVVGHSTLAGPFIWDKDSGMRQLKPLITPASEWKQLWSAMDINNKGQIVGNGLDANRLPRGFLLTLIKTEEDPGGL